MASIYPLVHPSWFNARIEKIFVDKENQALRFFRTFLVLKVIAPILFTHDIYSPARLLIKAILIITVFLAASRRFFLFALFIALACAFQEIIRSWPFTINHAGLEFTFLLIMCLSDESEPSHFSSVTLIKMLMLSVWVYSGIHKLFDGYYLNGEFFALELLSSDTTLGRHLSEFLSFIGNPFVAYSFSCCTMSHFFFSNLQIAIILLMSWLTIFLEIALPVMVFLPRTRIFGLVFLFIFQAVIAYFSGEIDFAFTAFATLFLFVPSMAFLLFPSLSALFLLVHPWT